MTWEEVLILFIMVMGLFAIDMLVAKFNLTAGHIVAVLTFFVLMPLGVVAGIVALICMNIRAKKVSNEKKSENISSSIETKSKTEETIKVRNKNTSKKKLKKLEKDRRNKQKNKIFATSSQKDNQKQKSNTATNRPTVSSGYAPFKPVTNSVSDYLYHYDPDYQDYLQGNIRPERYKNIDLIPNIRPKYTDQTVKIVFSPGTTEIKEKEFENRKDLISVVIPEGVKVRKQAFAGCENLKYVKLHDNVVIARDAFLYCNKLSDEAEQKIADKVEGMYRKTFVKSDFPYVTPIDDPNYDTTGEGLDTNKFIYETRRAQNGEFYTVCFSCLY